LKCESTIDLLSLYLDNRLTEGERNSVDEHVAFCARCARELRELRFTLDALRQMPEIAVQRSFAISMPSIQAQPIHSRQARYLLVFPYLRNATAGIAAALVLMFVTSLYLQANSQQYSFVGKTQAPVAASSRAVDVPVQTPGVSSKQAAPQSQANSNSASESAPVGPTAPLKGPLTAAPPAPGLSAGQAADSSTLGPTQDSGGGSTSAAAAKPAQSSGETSKRDAGDAQSGPQSETQAEPQTEQLARSSNRAPLDLGGELRKLAPGTASRNTNETEVPTEAPIQDLSTSTAWPLLEVQIVLLMLLLLSGTATFILWRKKA
jgi:anti-sigma factor RsiW